MHKATFCLVFVLCTSGTFVQAKPFTKGIKDHFDNKIRKVGCFLKLSSKCGEQAQTDPNFVEPGTEYPLIDVRAGSDSEELVTTEQTRSIISARNCAAGFRMDRSGTCRRVE